MPPALSGVPQAIPPTVDNRTARKRVAHLVLERALTRHRPEIYHPNQGVQDAARGYVGRLEAAGVQVSMADVGKPTQNGFAGRFMRTLKEEEVSLDDCQDRVEARARIGRFRDDFSMTKRVHSSRGYVTPAEFEAAHGA